MGRRGAPPGGFLPRSVRSDVAVASAAGLADSRTDVGEVHASRGHGGDAEEAQSASTTEQAQRTDGERDAGEGGPERFGALEAATKRVGRWRKQSTNAQTSRAKATNPKMK